MRKKRKRTEKGLTDEQLMQNPKYVEWLKTVEERRKRPPFQHSVGHPATKTWDELHKLHRLAMGGLQ